MLSHEIIIRGNLGRDPESRYLPSGELVVSMNVASNRTYTARDGSQVKETTWFRVSTFGKQAEACAKYLAKGSEVLIQGRLNSDKTTGGPKVFTRQDGTPGSSYEIVAQDVTFLGGKHEAQTEEPVETGEDIPF